MATNPEPPSRPWEDVAKEICGEKDAKKLIELGEELTKALDKERKRKADSTCHFPPTGCEDTPREHHSSVKLRQIV